MCLDQWLHMLNWLERRMLFDFSYISENSGNNWQVSYGSLCIWIINIKKTEVLFKQNLEAEHTQDPNVMIDNKPLEWLKSFKYLRSTKLMLEYLR